MADNVQNVDNKEHDDDVNEVHDVHIHVESDATSTPSGPDHTTDDDVPTLTRDVSVSLIEQEDPEAVPPTFGTKAKEFIYRYVPSTKWVPAYTPLSDFLPDLIAGLTTGVMLIPQGIAYAAIAGLSPATGLYTAFIPPMLYSFFGTSRQMSVAPVALVSLLTAEALHVLELEEGSVEYTDAAIVLALEMGMIQLLLGLLRVGMITSFISHSVLTGFTSAAGFIIGLSQMKHLLGIDVDRGAFFETLVDIIGQLKNVHGTTILIGCICLFLLLVHKRINKNPNYGAKSRMMPVGLLLIIFAIIFSATHKNNYGMAVLGEVPSGLPTFKGVKLTWKLFQAMLVPAAIMALIGFMESIAVGKAYALKFDYAEELDANQELVAIGLANIGGSFLQTFPVAGGLSRTAVNADAGAKTLVSSFISALVVMLCLLFLTGPLSELPKSVLAAMVIAAVTGLVDVKTFAHMWHVQRSDFYTAFITFVACLVFGVELGIGIGVIASLLAIIHRTAYPHTAVLGEIDDGVYRNLRRYHNARELDGVLLFRIDADLFFANIERFITLIHAAIKASQKRNATGAPIANLVLEFASVSHVDFTAMEELSRLINDLKSAGIRVRFASVKGPVREAFAVFAKHDKENKTLFEREQMFEIFPNISKACKAIDMDRHKRNDQMIEMNDMKQA